MGGGCGARGGQRRRARFAARGFFGGGQSIVPRQPGVPQRQAKITSTSGGSSRSRWIW